MTAPVTTARVGQRGTQPGLIELGSAVGALNPPLPVATIPATAKPLIAHAFNNPVTSFLTSLTVLNRPKIKWSLNGGYDSITILTATDQSSVVPLGSFVRITEQGGDGSVIYSGIVESTITTYDNPAQFGLVLTPLVSELGDTGFSTNYVNPTDIAQMVRDAVSSTLHLKFNSYTIPDTGQTAIYDFATTNCLDVLNVARLMAGTTYYWFVDAAGYVWFQFQGAGAEHTLRQMQEYTSSSKQPDITKLKNNFTVIGGIVPGSTSASSATYVGASTATYGSRTIMPPPTFPSLTDTPTLQKLANAIGGVLDRVVNRIDVSVVNYTTPIVPNQPGGPMVRLYEPSVYPTQQVYGGTGGYSGPYIALENERDGPIQKIKAGDIPINNVDDLKYMLDAIVQRIGVQPTVAAPFTGTNIVGSTIVGRGQITWDGNTPLNTITDGNANRIQLGNLAAYGPDAFGHTSQAGFGVRTLDSSGNLISDSFGLIGVMTSGGFAAGASSQALAGSGAGNFSDITNTSFSLNISRPVRIIYLFSAGAHTTAGAGSGYIRGNIVGFDTTSSLLFGNQSASEMGWYVSLPGGTFTTIPAGVYTVKMQMAADSGTTLTMAGFFHQVFLLGQ